MTPENTVLLVGATVKVLDAARAHGLSVILIQHQNKFTPQQADLADITLIADFTDWAAVRPHAEAAYERWGYATAIGLTDPALDAAARINDLFGLPGTSYQVSRLLQDKYQMRQRLAEAGTATAIGARLMADKQSLLEFGAEFGYPFVAKPTDTAASLGVFRVDTPSDVDGVWRELEALRGGPAPGCGGLFTVRDVLMEEYADGPEFSVESFSFGGRHVVVSVTEKTTGAGHFAELGHTVPARIDRFRENRIVGATQEFLDAVGLTDGPSHTEIRFGRRGPVVIESHNRIGGDRIHDLVEAVYGIDLTYYAVGWPFGLVDELRDRPKPVGGAAVRFVEATEGTVVAIDGLDELRTRPEVIAADALVSVGDQVRAARDNNDRLALVAATGPTGDAAVKLCEELIENTLRIQVVPK
ncbi:ATP-grasp domain-containing protein [Amycolatopsis sp. 195334CR]|uniref:ATP-grasp domain-containing protein n=1 Tax=Amycolatopsis sp. 195334CR TaxID=2814588 RepID=UPI001A8DF6E6|nr:ATP-grasp domain-containing protein [Amycolatopsis sp. 195334CR]MBN6036977.1 ATP-grasp domain-containing protein [Amycolatopsis sp. 195334CR]